MAQKGMDVEQVRNFGNQLKGQFAEQVRSIKTNLGQQVQGLDWMGDDANQFKGDRWNAVGQLADQLVAKLEELGQVALTNAQNQETTSGQV